MKSLAGTKMSFFCPLTGNLSDHDGDYYETDAYDLPYTPTDVHIFIKHRKN